MKKNQGYFLIMVLIFGGIAVTVISGLINFANTNILSGRLALKSAQAFELSEAGVEYYRWLLSHGGGNQSATIAHNFQNKDGVVIGSYEIVATPVGGIVRIVSTGTAEGSVRKIETEFLAGDGITFHYGVQSGTGGFILGNNAIVDGSVYSNGDIEGGNGSSIVGDAFAVGEITNVDTGSSHTGVLPKPFPITDAQILEWKGDADAAVFVGNRTLSGTNNSLGLLKIQGNLILNGGAVLTVTNTIWVTGNLTLGNGASISLSPNYGSSSGIIIVDGTVSLGNNATIAGSGAEGSSLMVISMSSSDPAISLGNGNTSSAILYAPDGGISIGNNAEVEAVAGEAIVLNNNVELQYQSGVIDEFFTSGPSGGWEQKGWKEIR